MHGLAVLQHDIVGNVHDVVDGPHPHGPQTLPHPFGGGADLHVAYHPGGVPGAQLRVGGLYVQQLREDALPAPLDLRLVEAAGLVEGGRRLTGQANHAEAVGPVGGDLKFHHVVVQAGDFLDVVPRLAVLQQDKDAVGDAVGELLLLGVEVGQGADGAGLGVEGHQVHGVDVLAVRLHRGAHRGAVLRPDQGHRPAAIPQGFYLARSGGHHGAENLVTQLDLRRDGGLVRVDGVVVVEEGGGGDDAVGEIPFVQAQLLQGAQHAIGQHPPQLALGDFLAAGQSGIVQGHGDQIPLVDVPRPGDDLDRLLFAHVQLAHPHVVRIFVAFHGQDAAHHHAGNFLPHVVGQLHLGAGEGHGLGELPVAGVNRNKLVEPFSA